MSEYESPHAASIDLVGKLSAELEFTERLVVFLDEAQNLLHWCHNKFFRENAEECAERPLLTVFVRCCLRLNVLPVFLGTALGLRDITYVDSVVGKRSAQQSLIIADLPYFDPASVKALVQNCLTSAFALPDQYYFEMSGIVLSFLAC